MGVPHEIEPRGGIVIGDAEFGGISGKAIIGLKVPSRVLLNKIVICRTDSPGVGGFAVDIYNRREAAFNTPVTDADGNALSRELFVVQPTIAGTLGVARYDADESPGGFGHYFFSQDPLQQTPITGVSDRLQANNRVLWVVITTTDGWEFCVNIGSSTDMQ